MVLRYAAEDLTDRGSDNREYQLTQQHRFDTEAH
jgi:hypothetical protein